MSICGSCPLYWAESHGLPKSMECAGNEPHEDCVERLQDYIDKLNTVIRDMGIKLAENEWQWHETERDVWLSHHDWPRDITWAIIRVLVTKNRKNTGWLQTVAQYEVSFMRTDTKSFCSQDVWQNKVPVKVCDTMDQAKTWVYENHENYIKKREKSKDA